MTTATRPDLAGRILRRSINLRRYENDLAARVTKLLIEARDEIISELTRLDPTIKDGGYRRRRLQALLEQTNNTLRSAYRDIRTLSVSDLRKLAEIQSEATIRDLAAAVSEAEIGTVAVGATRLRAIVDTHPIQGALLGDWMRQQNQRTQDAVARQIRLGLVQSETIDDLVRRIRGRSVGGGRYVGGVMDTSTREATTIVRTAANEVASRAQQMTLEANKDIAPKYQWLATLDERTCPVCGARDGEQFDIEDEAAPRPPAHMNCRCTFVAVVDWKSLGLELPPPPTRASADGPVSAKLDYEGWLRQQSAAEQDDILGPSRGLLFRQGKVSLREMVAHEGRTLTLDELKARL